MRGLTDGRFSIRAEAAVETEDLRELTGNRHRQDSEHVRYLREHGDADTPASDLLGRDGTQPAPNPRRNVSEAGVPGVLPRPDQPGGTSSNRLTIHPTGWSARERELYALNHVLKSDASPRVHMVQTAEHQDSWGSIQLRRLNEHDVSIAEVSIHPLAIPTPIKLAPAPGHAGYDEGQDVDTFSRWNDVSAYTPLPLKDMVSGRYRRQTTPTTRMVILALGDHERSRFQYDMGRPFMHDWDGNAMLELDSSGNAHHQSVRILSEDRGGRRRVRSASGCLRRRGLRGTGDQRHEARWPFG
eukprot:COSAG05_NODE_8_length_40675_cov_148.837539_7_plen_299_part_00